MSVVAPLNFAIARLQITQDSGEDERQVGSLRPRKKASGISLSSVASGLCAASVSRYGQPRSRARMSRDTGIPDRTLSRCAKEGTDKPRAMRRLLTYWPRNS
jgi:hypothetical protein